MLEHFRAGLRLPFHRFIHSLLVEVQLGLEHICLNLLRNICTFITRFSEQGEPTLRLFWSLYK